MSASTKKNKPWYNRLGHTLRSAERTLSRQLCLGPRKIVSSNLGTPAEQCGKFKRYSQLHEEYSKDPELRDIFGFLKADQVYFAMLNDVFELPQTSNTLAPQVLDRFRTNKPIAQMMLASIPDTPEYSNIKTELRYFIPFMYNVYANQIQALMDSSSGKIGSTNHTRYVNNPYIGGLQKQRRRRRQTRKRR